MICRHNFLKIIFMLALLACFVYTQDTATVMTWNILEYNGIDTNIRNQYFRTVLNHAKPHLLVVEEMHTAGLADGFLANVLNNSGNGSYSMAAFINGFDTDNAAYYKTTLFHFVSNTPIKTVLRDINEFKFVYLPTNDTIRLFAVHLKAGNTMNDELQRANEADSLRKYTNQLPLGTNFLILGDYNIYRNEEPANIKLKMETAGNEGHGIDALNLTGVWNNPAYSAYHTQSSRIRSFGGGATGGLDDRFDFILYSKAVQIAGGIRILTNTITMIGNDGLHYNDSINKIPNNSVPQPVADALHYASDHLPVTCKLVFEPVVSVEKEKKYFSDILEVVVHPNPFNPETTISFKVETPGYYKIVLFDVSGRELNIIHDKYTVKGEHKIKLSGSALSSGIYFGQLIHNGHINSVFKLVNSK